MLFIVLWVWLDVWVCMRLDVSLYVCIFVFLPDMENIYSKCNSAFSYFFLRIFKSFSRLHLFIRPLDSYLNKHLRFTNICYFLCVSCG